MEIAKSTYTFILVLLLSLFSLEAVSQQKDIVIKGNVHSNKDLSKSFVYVMTGYSKETTSIYSSPIQNKRFYITLSEQYKDTVVYAFAFVSHLPDLTHDQYVKNIKTIAGELHTILIDTSSIELDVTYPGKQIIVKGGQLNSQKQEFDEVYANYIRMIEAKSVDKAHVYSGNYLTDANRFNILTSLELVNKYSSSLYALEQLKILANLPVPRLTYTYKDEIRAALDNLSPELQIRRQYKKVYENFERNLELNESKNGVTFPNLTLVDTDQKKYSFQQISQDKPYMLIDFWATWCGPCIHQHPTVKKLAEKYKDSNIQIVGISVDQKLEAWLKYNVKHAFNYPQFRFNPEDKTTLEEIGAQKLPTYMLVDTRSGKIVEYDIPIGELDKILTAWSSK